MNTQNNKSLMSPEFKKALELVILLREHEDEEISNEFETYGSWFDHLVDHVADSDEGKLQ